MRGYRAIPALAVGLCLALLAMGCAAPSTDGNVGNTPHATPTATVPPTATPRPKPTKAPPITVALCQQIMSVAQANQITHPSTAATTIRVQSTAQGGSCNYEYAPLRGTISILIGDYPGGSLSDLANQALRGTFANSKVTTAEPVSGLGDQAYFGGVTSSLSFSGITIGEKQQELFVVDGKVVFIISAGLVNGAGGIGNVTDAQALAEFEQIAPLVLAHLL